ncbi:sulfotransferase family protein [Streptomonospora litoralis]|uniref:Sulfotransferase domain protein n=1 Tax=Streptomonospora litoralis TaxID=2498135 RepID=A0A4P6Q521_9ACTN|nr:sulfotransferase [Streptomonospora litoralis]QBI55818.1 Sulfotransferase domain protein [Streptomonospora litoralis]
MTNSTARRLPFPEPVKHSVRSVHSALAQATREARALPTFIIAGAQRCGTTSLFRALVQHPQVAGPPLRKGVHYFDTGYARGIGWYRGHFPLRALVRSGSGRTRIEVGESSPYYLFHPLAAERLARDLPGVKVVVMLRDPVERAYSAHSHERARGFESEPFERALELEPERLRGEEERLRSDPGAWSHAHQHQAYLSRGRYAEQLRRLEGHLGRHRVHVVESEAFFTDPERVFTGVEDFLGVDHCDRIRFSRHNARPRRQMPERLRARLSDHFLSPDEDLAQWWGRTPAWRA